MSAVVELHGAARSFGEGVNRVDALIAATMTVERGEFIAIVGRSGSGKSTLLNIVGLMDAPTAGTYVLDGYNTAGLSAARTAVLRGTHIGFVFQSFHLVSTRSVLDNVALSGLYTGLSRRERLERSARMLERVGLGDRCEQRPGQLSGGERQRVAIARALVNRPRLLLADEPTGNLDSATATEVLDLFGSLHDDGMTVMMITHDLSVAKRAQRQVVMADGVLDG